MHKKIAIYGGTFDPVHRGHLDVATGVVREFGLDELMFVPAFHAPHKRRSEPTSAFHRFAMLCEASDSIEKTRVSTLEVEQPETPFTIETIGRIKELHPDDRIFKVIGADSWEEITTWRRWEDVLSEVDIIVVTRPGYEICTDHVTDSIRDRIVDLRDDENRITEKRSVYFTDAAYTDLSATRIRKMIREGDQLWRELLHPDVAAHIEKYRLYD